MSDMTQARKPRRKARSARRGGSGLGRMIFAVIIVSAIAIGFGGLIGAQLVDATRAAIFREITGEELSSRTRLYFDEGQVRRLSPIVTNLAFPPEMFVRLEVSVAYREDADVDAAVLGPQIAGDITAYMRTLRLTDLEGPSALQYLSEDLNDRARIRSGDRIHELILESLVVQ